MKSVYVDTSAICGFLNRRDPLHTLSISVLEELINKKYNFYSNQWVEYESLTTLKSMGNSLCIAYNKLKENIKLNILPVEKQLENSAVELFWKYDDKYWSIIDCVSIIDMYNRNLIYVYGCDHHFKQAKLFPLIEYNHIGTPEKTFNYL